jgi:hypothetical protein
MPATIRAATPADTAAIFALTYELAEFEQLTHLFAATQDDLHDALFGSRPSIEALVAESEERLVGYALFFHNYSSFVGKTSTCNRHNAAAGWAPRFCSASRRLRWNAAADDSSGPCWTGISRPSVSTRRWARLCCRIGAWCASRAMRLSSWRQAPETALPERQNSARSLLLVRIDA